MARLTRFSITTLLLIITILAVALGWWADHANLTRKLELETVTDALALANEFKQHNYRVSDHLGHGTAAAEQALTSHLVNPKGELVTSHGWGEILQVRLPTSETIEHLLPLLNHVDSDVRQKATELLALYGEAFCTLPLHGDDVATFDSLKSKATPRLIELLEDSNDLVRRASALALGQFARRDEVAASLIRAFKQDKSINRLYLAWALRRKF